MDIPRRPPGTYRPSRREIDVAGSLFVDGDLVGVRLLDISRDGAKLSLSYPILAGTAVELRVHGARIPALVQWHRELRAGVRFLDRMERETLALLEEAGEDDIFD